MTRYLLLGLALAGMLITAAPAQANPVPGYLLNYQGNAYQTTSMLPISDGAYNIKIELYGQPTGGYALWDESFSAVEVVEGVFNLQLSVPFDLYDGRALWVQTVFQGEPFAERQLLRPQAQAVYALQAEHASLGMQPAYDSGWVHILPAQTMEVAFDLPYSAQYYNVVLLGKSATGMIHQANLGTNPRDGLAQGWYGCEWFDFTANGLQVTRGGHDADLVLYEKDWKWFRVRLYKNR